MKSQDHNKTQPETTGEDELVTIVPVGRSGKARVTVNAPEGRITDEIKIVARKQREDLVASLEGRIEEQELGRIREALDEAAASIAQDPSGDHGGPQKPAEVILALFDALDDVELFHAPSDPYTGYVTVNVGPLRQTLKISARPFEQFLARLFYESTSEAAPSGALSDALNVLKARATFDGPAIPIHVRLAPCKGGIALDLANDQGQVVVIDKRGWTVTSGDCIDVRFYRPNGVLPLPVPRFGGSVEKLRPLVNLDDDVSWVLVVAALTAYLVPEGPYPIIVISGEQGSAKSVLSRMLQRLIDPSGAGLRRMPKNEEDLIIGASRCHLLCYDNLSGLKAVMSDAFCALATGSGFAARKLFTNDEEVQFQACRPIILNGIDELTGRADLLDRSILVQLPTLGEERRATERDLWSNFDDVAPDVLGALLTAVSSVLKNRDEVHLDAPPRMADFATVATAAEDGLGWEPGRFLRAYRLNRELAQQLAIERSPVGLGVMQLMAESGEWEGTAGELLARLTSQAGSAGKTGPGWPQNPEGLSHALKRVAPVLRARGVEVTTGVREPGGMRRRLIRLTRCSAPGGRDSWDGWDSCFPTQDSEAGESPLGTAGGRADSGASRESSKSETSRPNRPNCPEREGSRGRQAGEGEAGGGVR